MSRDVATLYVVIDNSTRGFAAKAPAKALESVSTLGAEYNPIIEEDQMVSIDGEIVSDGHLN